MTRARTPGEDLPLLAYRPARARASDPSGSHAAADRAERSGLIRGHSAAIVRAICTYPGATARKLAAYNAVDLLAHQIGKRTSELERDGWILRRDSGRGEDLRLYPTRKAIAWHEATT